MSACLPTSLVMAAFWVLCGFYPCNGLLLLSISPSLSAFLLLCRYQLRVCAEACRSHLLGLDSKEISWDTALTMLHLPPGLREAEAFTAITEVNTPSLPAVAWHVKDKESE